jgi:predicted permease
MSMFRLELRSAWRALARSPGFALTTIFMLGAGLGLVMFMFGAIESFVLRPLPFANARGLAYVYMTNPRSADDRIEFPTREFLALREAQTSFDELAGWYEGTVNLSDGERPERYSGAFVTANLFDALGAKPLMGRALREGDDVPGAAPVVVLGYTVWQNRFNGERDIVGKRLRVNGRVAEVVGVMPQYFVYPRIEDVFVPVNLDPAAAPDAMVMEVVGQLRAGVTLEQAQAEISAVTMRLAKAAPEQPLGTDAHVEALGDRLTSPNTRRILYTMFASVLLVLCIACANVANLLLARAAARARETAIRNALGASRSRLVGQVMAEIVLIALAAGLLGFVIAQWGAELVMAALRSSEDPPPRWTTEVRISSLSVLFALGVALVSAMLAGLLPAWRIARSSPAAVMREGGHGTAGGLGRLGRTLAGGEIAMCVVLLICSGLTLRSAMAIEGISLGADIRNVLSGRIALFDQQYPDDAAVVRFSDALQERLSRIPGIESVTISTSLPMTFSNADYLGIEGEEISDSRELAVAQVVSAAPSYYGMLRIPLLRGRLYDASDDAAAPPVVVISERLAERHWPGADPIGKRLRLGRGAEDQTWRKVVGVVPHVEQDGDDVSEGLSPLYLPFAQSPARFLSFAVRGTAAPHSYDAAVREAVRSIDPDQPVYFLRSLEEWHDIAAFDHRLLVSLFGIFGLFALVLAAGGMYAVLAYAVSQRTREIGVRRALGADDRGIVRMVMQQGALQLAVGLVLGLAVATAFARLLSNVLYGVSPFDPLTFIGVPLLLTAVAMLAAMLPTRRALTVAPMTALRDQ